ncbi:MAG: hypothetical protein WC554_07180 [Clostridia bacterium]
MPDYKNIVNFKTYADKKNFADYKQTGGSAPASLYQEWAGYSDTPLLTADYQYQYITVISGTSYLVIGNNGQMYRTDPTICMGGAFKWTAYSGGNWTVPMTDGMTEFQEGTLTEANNNIYTDIGLGTVYFAKTTP